MERQSVSPETLAAQGLGEEDPASGGLVPVINLSTNYEQQPDGSYRQGRVYTRADNPTSEHAERLWRRWRAAGALARCSARGWRRPPRSSSRCCPAITCWSRGSCTGGCANGWPSSRLPGAWTWSSPTPPILTRWRPRSGRVGPGCSGGWRRLTVDVGDHRPGRRLRACARGRGPGGRGQHRGDTGADAAVRIRRGSGGAFGYQVPQRARRRAGRGGAGRPPGSVLGADPVLAPQRGRDAGAVRGVAAAARHAHPVPAGAPLVGDRYGHRRAL